MGGIGGIVVVEDDELLFFAALDDLRGACIELGFDLVDDWENEGGKKAEYENIELFCPWSILYLKLIS